MAYLTINGIPVSVGNDSVELAEVRHGETTTRNFDGSYRTSVRAFKREWSGQAVVQTQANAYALKNLLRGLGHHWSFDTDEFSDKGLGPSSASANGNVGASSPSPKFGAGRYKVNSGFAGDTWTPGISTLWTVMIWRYNGATWDHYVVDSSARKWVNGTRNDAASTTWLTVSSGNVTLTAPSGDEFFDDMVVLPYELPTTWPPIFGVATSAFSALPRLTAAGDFSPSTSITVEATVGSSTPMQAVVDSAWRDNAETFEFTLIEV